MRATSHTAPLPPRIACVSPLEYNLSETLNTLRYGQRARAIKNRAEVNEVEIGWDDIEHLQSTIRKMRKEMELLKAGGGNSANGNWVVAANGGPEPTELAEKLDCAKSRLADLQEEHDLVRLTLQVPGPCLFVAS